MVPGGKKDIQRALRVPCKQWARKRFLCKTPWKLYKILNVFFLYRMAVFIVGKVLCYLSHGVNEKACESNKTLAGKLTNRWPRSHEWHHWRSHHRIWRPVSWRPPSNYRFQKTAALAPSRCLCIHQIADTCVTLSCWERLPYPATKHKKKQITTQLLRSN